MKVKILEKIMEVDVINNIYLREKCDAAYQFRLLSEEEFREDYLAYLQEEDSLECFIDLKFNLIIDYF